MSSTSKYISALVLVLSPLVMGALDTSPQDISNLQGPSGYSLIDSPPPVDRNPQGRLGFITYANDVTGTASSVSPLKIELGGVFLGTLLGFGLVLLAPKVSELFHPHHGGHQYHSGFSRSEDQNIMGGLTKIMSRIDETLQESNIDSMACLERAACTYVQSSGQPGSSIFGSNSSLLNFAIDGSKLKTALDRGLNGENCSLHYPQCSFTKSALVTGIRSLMAS